MARDLKVSYVSLMRQDIHLLEKNISSMPFFSFIPFFLFFSLFSFSSFISSSRPSLSPRQVVFSLYLDKKTNKEVARNVRLTDEQIPGMSGDQTGILDVVVLR